MGLGAGELVLILVIAYVVVGPEDMAKLARNLGKAMRQLRKMSSDLSREAAGGLQLSSVSDLNSYPEKIIQNTVEKNAAGSVSKDLDSVLKEIEKAEAQLEQKKE